jgi:proton-dependent oligopeptide transporter, POT family
MAKTQYRTALLKTDRMPPGISFIVVNEAAERFSFCGANSILVIFLIRYLMGALGRPAPMSDAQAGQWCHPFVSLACFLPALGAVPADALFGKYLVIPLFPVVFGFARFAFTRNNARLGRVIGLSLIAPEAGGIKPSVSANVGSRFGASNRHLPLRIFIGPSLPQT